MCFVGP
jgi:hypothetical protein